MRKREDRDAGGAVPRWVPVAILLALAVVCAALAFFAGGRVIFEDPDRNWLAGAVRSRGFLVPAVVMLVSVVLVAALLTVCWRIGRGPRMRAGREDGAAIIEFAMILPFLLMLVLIMVQSSLLMGGNLCVHYAAFCAARSAIVMVPANAGANEPRNVIQPSEISAKYRRIKMAAVWAVLPVSAGGPNVPTGDAEDLVQGLQRFFSVQGLQPPGWLDDRLKRKLHYASEYTAVELADAEKGKIYGEHEDIRVRVSHTLYLSVPYGNWLFAQLQDGVRLGFGEGEYGTVVRATSALTNEGIRDHIDRELYTD